VGAVNVLLDTHALIWWLDDDARLSRRARKVIADANNTVFVSSASALEMATKVRLGKLRDPTNVIPRLSATLVERGMIELPISVAHATEAGSLGGTHRDPFDRMLIAQSRIEELPVVSVDPVFAHYEVRVVW
jgi:PIN domain nuclease of toxin-antitoxin system